MTDRLDHLRARGCALLEDHGSPLYVFSEADLRRNYRTLRDSLDEHYPDSTVHFAVKSNYNLGVLAVLQDAGCAAEAYARCELTAARRAGFDPVEVLLTGMNRHEEDLERAFEAGVRRVLVDNAAELDRVAAAAATVGATPEVLVRVNPAMEVPTRPEIATATRESKFGLDVESGCAMAVAEAATDRDEVRLAGVQLHIGSQIRSAEPYAVAAEELLAFAADVRDRTGVEIGLLDLGGGFPVEYDEAVPDTAEIVATVAGTVREAAAAADLPEPHLLFEPGRRLVADSGSLLATVGVVKETPHAAFAVLDAGTNAVSSHWPYPIHALKDGEATREYTVAGPLCYSGDVLSEGVALPALGEGDVLAVDRIGAYSLGSATHTNAEPKPAAVLLREDGGVDVVRERETCEDVLERDQVPDL